MSNLSAVVDAAQGRAITVPFHGANLYVVEHNSQPYTPLKPIVTGMGLTWHGQHAKLKSMTERWGVLHLRIPAEAKDAASAASLSDGGAQTMICLPLRKLPGWLMSIEAGKVKSDDVRNRVIAYQNECDDVLWEYWNEGGAVNPRAFVVGPTDLLTEREQNALREIVKTAAERLPKEKQGPATIKMWSKLKAHFGVAYRQIPRSEFTQAVSLLTRASTEWTLAEEAPKLISAPLSQEQKDAIQALSQSLVERTPTAKQGELIIKLWNAQKSKFGCGLDEIPADRFTEALSLMARTAVDWELVDEPLGASAVMLTPQEACDMAAFLPSMLQARAFFVEMYPALEAMKSPLIGKYEEHIAMGTAQRKRLERVQDACTSILEQFVGHKLADGPPPSDDSVLHANAWGHHA